MAKILLLSFGVVQWVVIMGYFLVRNFLSIKTNITTENGNPEKCQNIETLHMFASKKADHARAQKYQKYVKNAKRHQNVTKITVLSH